MDSLQFLFRGIVDKMEAYFSVIKSQLKIRRAENLLHFLSRHVLLNLFVLVPESPLPLAKVESIVNDPGTNDEQQAKDRQTAQKLPACEFDEGRHCVTVRVARRSQRRGRRGPRVRCLGIRKSASPPV